MQYSPGRRIGRPAGKGVTRMNSIRTNRLQWLLSGALGASLALAPALVAQQQAGRPHNRLRPRASRVTGVRRGRRPMRRMDRFPRRNAAQDQTATDRDPNQSAGPGPAPISRPGSRSGPGPISQSGAATACPGGWPRGGLRTASAACLSARPKPTQRVQRIPGPSGSAGSAALRPGHFDQGYAAGDSHQ